MKIFYEDNHVIVVEKPHGVLVQADENDDRSLLEDVKAFIKERDHKPGKVFLALVHRLDRPVGGVILFGKTTKGASRISAQFRERTIQKTYVALVEGVPEREKGEVNQWLLKDKRNNLVEEVRKGTSDAKLAELRYEVVDSFEQNGSVCSLVRIWPKTGRPHQIRVAMKTLGTPNEGYKKNGARKSYPRCIAKWTSGLAFNQAVTKERIEVKSDPDWLKKGRR